MKRKNIFKRGSELTEKIMITAFSVAAAAACIVWMVGIINISKAVDINGNGAGGDGGSLSVQGKTKIAWNMSADQEYSLFTELSRRSQANGTTLDDESREMARQANASGSGYIPSLFAGNEDMGYFGTASFSSLPTNEQLTTAFGTSDFSFVDAGYFDMVSNNIYGMPVGKALVFTLCCFNEDNLTAEAKTAASVCDINTESPCQENFFKAYVYGGTTLLDSISGSGNFTYTLNIPALVAERTSDATSDSESHGFGESNFAYAVYRVAGEEALLIYNSDDGKMYDLGMSPVGPATLQSVQPASSPYFSTTVLD